MKYKLIPLKNQEVTKDDVMAFFAKYPHIRARVSQCCTKETFNDLKFDFRGGRSGFPSKDFIVLNAIERGAFRDDSVPPPEFQFA